MLDQIQKVLYNIYLSLVPKTIINKIIQIVLVLLL